MRNPDHLTRSSRKRTSVISISLILFTFFAIIIFQPEVTQPALVSGMAINEDIPPNPAIESAIREAIDRESDRVLSYLVNDIIIENYQLSKDGATGTAWLVFVDRETGNIIPTEPGLVIYTWSDDRWEVSLPSDIDWYNTLTALPADVMEPETLAHWQELYQQSAKTVDSGPYGGYLLPWRPNLEIILTRSITHYSPPNPSGDMHYSFDFAHPWVSGGSPMFELLAAKSGRVQYAHWTQENGSETSPGNYIVIEDISTDPPTYMLYLHLAQDSIPEELRVKGAPVTQGQYIGLADDTGMSTGNHLHFQVHTNSISYWGKAVDITFDDVDINGGRPRTCGEAYTYPQYGSECHTGDRFTSENYYLGDRTAPTGTILSPSPGSIVTTSEITIQGTAQDDHTGLRSVEILANYNGSWHTISPEFTSSPFEYSWDMCAAGVPDGPVAIYLQIQDIAGNINYDYPSLRYFTKHAACQSTTTCTPGANEVAIFKEPGYQGECKVMAIGEYPYSSNFSPLSDNQISSIRVGDLAAVSLYTSSSYAGRQETLTRDDPNLLDNRIGSNTISSLKVTSVGIPAAPTLTYPPDGTDLLETQSIDLIVDPATGAHEFQFELLSSTSTNTSDWSDRITWNLGGLTPGQYQWRARARNDYATGNWSTYADFEVIDYDLVAGVEIAPVSYSFESGTKDGWMNTGYWALVNNSDLALSGTWFWQYTRTGISYYDGLTNFADLTSPLITIPITSTQMALEFWYKYDTENSYQHWDQRWLQLSINGGPFTNTLQLTNDPEDFWMKTTIPLELDTSITNTIQARFHFNTVDAIDNSHTGWFIDEFSIVPNSSDPCSFTPEDNNWFTSAQSVVYGNRITGEICPPGDVDYFKFSGQSGDQIVIDVDRLDASTLDSMVFLYDQNQTLLTINDDEDPYILLDPYLTYTLPTSGEYYFHIQPWDKQQGTGIYSFRFTSDNQPPTIESCSPSNSSFIFDNVVPISMDVSDESGIASIAYYWHHPDWADTDWELISIVDGTETDDYTIYFTRPELELGDRVDFYATVTDQFGNWTATGEWKTYYLNVVMQVFLPKISR